jgi:hypothetical protein
MHKAENTSLDKDAIRKRWPNGFWGWLRYFTDHVIYRYKRPVDWGAAMAIEEGFLHGTIVCEDGGFAVIHDDEYDVFKALGKGRDLSQLREDLNLSDPELNKHVRTLLDKLGAQDIQELKGIATRHVMRCRT